MYQFSVSVKWFSFSALTLLVGWQEGHPAYEKLGVGLLVVIFWLELCWSYGSSQWCSPRDQGLALKAPRGQKWKSWSWIMKSWSCSWTFGLVLGLEEKVLQFFKTFVVILDGSEQRTPWHFVRDSKSSLPFRSHCLRTFCAPCTSASVERVFNNGGYLLGYTDASKAQCIDCGKLLSLGSNKPGKQTVHGLKCHLEKCHKDIHTYTKHIHCIWGKWNPVNKDHPQERRNWTRYWQRIVGLTLWLKVWKRKKALIIPGDFRFLAENERLFSFRFRP